MAELWAMLGGLLLPLAFSPFDMPVLVPIALGLLFMSWINATPLQALRRGYWFGLGQYGFGISWIYVSMHDYGGASVFEATGLTALFAVCMAWYPALAGWLAVRFFRGSAGFRLIAVYPAVWMLIEWIRGWFLTGFTWLQVGYSQTDTLLSHVAPLLGSYGVGWITALLAGLAFSLAWLSRSGRKTALAGLVLILVVSQGLGLVRWSQPEGEPFTATLLQGNIPQDAKWQPEFQQATLLRYLNLTRKHWQSRLIIWPETAVPAFYHQVRQTYLTPLETEARQHGTDLLIGVPYLDESTHQYYNALVNLGQTPGVYLKRHLVPFGEFLPLRSVLGAVLNILDIPLTDFTAGSPQQPLLQAAGHPLTASICYEDIFGQESLLGLPEARYLVNVTNDAWFGDSMAPHQHAQMARMRAIETSRYLLRATNTGLSVLVGPDGRIQTQGPLFQTTEVTGLIQPLSGATPYVLWGDGVFVMVILITLIWALWTSRLTAPEEHPHHE
ncbi:MAG: apolipoprotein N-acyltransferase [Methylococcaceae bacterium]